MQNLNVKKNSIADIKTDLKLCFPGARTAGSAAAQGEKARGSSRGCYRAARPSRWRSWGPRKQATGAPLPAYASPSGPAWDLAGFQGTSPPRFPAQWIHHCETPNAGFRRPPGCGRLWAAAPSRPQSRSWAPLSLPPSLPPPPPGLRGPSEHPAAFRGAEAGAPCPSPQLPQRAPCRGAGHAGCGAPGCWQGSREGPLPGAGARASPPGAERRRRRAQGRCRLGARSPPPALPLGSPLFIVSAPLPWLVSFITGWQTWWPRGRLSLKTQKCREGRSPDCRPPPRPPPRRPRPDQPPRRATRGRSAAANAPGDPRPRPLTCVPGAEGPEGPPSGRPALSSSAAAAGPVPGELLAAGAPAPGASRAPFTSRQSPFPSFLEQPLRPAVPQPCFRKVGCCRSDPSGRRRVCGRAGPAPGLPAACHPPTEPPGPAFRHLCAEPPPPRPRVTAKPDSEPGGRAVGGRCHLPQDGPKTRGRAHPGRARPPAPWLAKTGPGPSAGRPCDPRGPHDPHDPCDPRVPRDPCDPRVLHDTRVPHDPRDPRDPQDPRDPS